MSVVPAIAGGARYAAVFLVMMSNLMLELLLTRIFSATMWYHFAFMAVSIALFGTTVGAVAVHVWPAHFRPERAWPLAARYALFYAVAIVACTVLQLQLNVTFGSSWRELGTLAYLHVLVAIPFVLSGVFICLVLVRAEREVGAVYGADLLGAAAGCALFVPFVAAGQGPRSVLWLGAMAGAGAALMAVAAGERRTVARGAVVSILCVVAFAANLDRRALQVHWAKGRWDRDHIFQKWNAFSRITIDPLPAFGPFGWGFGSKFVAQARPGEEKVLAIDNAAVTVLTEFDGDLSKLSYLEWGVTTLPYVIRPQGKVLVIGVGGGRDVLAALHFGSRRIVGVEVNGDILWLLRGPFAEFTGGIASHPRVELVADEARSFVARSAERFDIIQASLVDTWAAAANGAYVLSENALYTREAFNLFLDHLTPRGVISVSRWYVEPQPGETLRLVSLAAAVLRERGSENPAAHLFLARGRPGRAAVATLLVSAQPLDAADISTLRRWSAEKGFKELLGPGGVQDEKLAALAGPEAPVELWRQFPLDLSPPSDDRPFFFNMVRMRSAFTGSAAASGTVRANADAVTALGWLLLLVMALSALFILVPLRWRRGAERPARGASLRLVYFAGLGLGFILIELAQMQRLMIALGHPVYGLTVVLFSLLAAAGLGSLWTARVARRGMQAAFIRRALLVLLVVAAATAAAALALAQPLEAAGGWVRIGGSVLMLAPLGFVLGVPLASGLALSARDPQGYRALYWGMNGAASVCGAVLAVMLSLAFGITATYGCGMLAYGVCAVIVPSAFRNS